MGTVAAAKAGQAARIARVAARAAVRAATFAAFNERVAKRQKAETEPKPKPKAHRLAVAVFDTRLEPTEQPLGVALVAEDTSMQALVRCAAEAVGGDATHSRKMGVLALPTGGPMQLIHVKVVGCCNEDVGTTCWMATPASGDVIDAVFVLADNTSIRGLEGSLSTPQMTVVTRVLGAPIADFRKLEVDVQPDEEGDMCVPLKQLCMEVDAAYSCTGHPHEMMKWGSAILDGLDRDDEATGVRAASVRCSPMLYGGARSLVPTYREDMQVFRAVTDPSEVPVAALDAMIYALTARCVHEMSGMTLESPKSVGMLVNGVSECLVHASYMAEPAPMRRASMFTALKHAVSVSGSEWETVAAAAIDILIGFTLQLQGMRDALTRSVFGFVLLQSVLNTGVMQTALAYDPETPLHNDALRALLRQLLDSSRPHSRFPLLHSLMRSHLLFGTQARSAATVPRMAAVAGDITLAERVWETHKCKYPLAPNPEYRASMLWFEQGLSESVPPMYTTVRDNILAVNRPYRSAVNPSEFHVVIKMIHPAPFARGLLEEILPMTVVEVVSEALSLAWGLSGVQTACVTVPSNIYTSGVRATIGHEVLSRVAERSNGVWWIHKTPGASVVTMSRPPTTPVQAPQPTPTFPPPAPLRVDRARALVHVRRPLLAALDAVRNAGT